MSFIRRSEERKTNVAKNFKGGPGEVHFHPIIEADSELNNHGRLFNELTLEKGCGVGWHVHEGDSEMYVILSGEAKYNDNGTETVLHPGDVTYTGPGEGHSITNEGDEPVYALALILYA